MALLNLKEVLKKAKKEKYAVIATVAFNFDCVETIIRGSRRKKFTRNSADR